MKCPFTKGVHIWDVKNAMFVLDGSQTSIFLYFYLIVERIDRIGRELDASRKLKTSQSWGWGPRRISHSSFGFLCSNPLRALLTFTCVEK